jgi:hypothetical protein
MNTSSLVLVLLVLLIIVCYMSMYDLRESFGCYKRQINGLYNGLTDNSNPLWTLEESEKDKVENILKSILVEINKKVKSKLHYLYIDQVTKEKKSENNYKYIVDFFVHELKDQTTKRIMIIFNVDENTKDVSIETLNLSNAIISPEKVFMELPGDRLILKDSNIGHRLGSTDYNVMGINNSNIEFSILDNKDKLSKQVPHENPSEFQKWILPMSIHETGENCMLNYPCRKQFKCWDVDGIHINEEETSTCKGLNNSNRILPKRPYENPTVNRMETIDNDYYWLFDLSRGISGFPHGQSVSGP